MAKLTEIAIAHGDLKLMKGVRIWRIARMPEIDMTRKILTALATISFLLVTFASPHSAEERQVGDRNTTGFRSQGNTSFVNTDEAEKLRTGLIAAYAETDALIRFLAGYDFIRQTNAMADYEVICQKLETERVRIEKMPAAELMLQINKLPNANSLNRIIETSRSIRTDAKLQEVIRKVERLSQAGRLSRNSSSGRAANLRGVIAAPAYILPLCNFDDPSNYPSGADLAISNGVGLALHALADALPGILGFFLSFPNPATIALQIAAYAVDEVTNALDAVASDATYCEAVRLYVEDNLVNDDGYTALLITNDFYFTYLLQFVRSSLKKATNTGIPTNCGNTRLTEAMAYFDGSDAFSGTGAQRITAYHKLRAAYQNIGAAACVF